MTINIRLATKEDAQLVKDFIDKLAIYQKEGSSVTVNTELLHAQLEAKNPPFECLIAEMEGHECGFALFYNNYSTWEGRPGIYLEDLYVEPQFRLHGIGRKLLLELCQIALTRGCTRLDWSVQSTNHKAIEFYSLLGATPMPEWIKWRLDEAQMIELVDVDRGLIKFPEITSVAVQNENNLAVVSREDAHKLAKIH